MTQNNNLHTTLVLLAMVICGIAVTLSFDPFGWWPLSLVAAALLNLALEKSSPDRERVR